MVSSPASSRMRRGWPLQRDVVTGMARPVDRVPLADFSVASVVPGATPIPTGQNVCEFCGQQKDPATGACACTVADAGYAPAGFAPAGYPPPPGYGAPQPDLSGYGPDPGYGPAPRPYGQRGYGGEWTGPRPDPDPGSGPNVVRRRQ